MPIVLQKDILIRDGQLVQSHGERIIADFLHREDIEYRYDERIRIIQGHAIRLDFYLPEFDLYIEYWGMMHPTEVLRTVADSLLPSVAAVVSTAPPRLLSGTSGMNTTHYKIGMLKKKQLYQQEGKKLLSLTFRDKPRLEEVLCKKVSRYCNLG